MHPVPVGDESLPAFLVPNETSGQYAAPMLLSTGEINGHGGSLFLMPAMNTAATNTEGDSAVDAVQSSGAGGVSFVDFTVLDQASTTPVAQRFAVPVNLVSTNEIGAAEDGSATQPIAIGHGEGVTVSGNHLYFADGPHGVSVWTIANGTTPIDELHLVANTLQSEYPTGDTVLPTPHAFKVAFGADPTQAYVMSQSLGMRRVNVSSVTSGAAQVRDELASAGPLAERTWGERNTARICHPLAGALPSPLRGPLCMPADPLPGDGNMPLVQAPGFGASERMVVSPGREADGIAHMPGGQSGHPMSPFWGAGHAAWVRGEASPFLPGEPAHALTLTPEM